MNAWRESWFHVKNANPLNEKNVLENKKLKLVCQYQLKSMIVQELCDLHWVKQQKLFQSFI